MTTSAAAGRPTSACSGKIKQAYGLAYQHAPVSAASTPSKTRSGAALTEEVPDPVIQEQMAREAGRKAQIDTLRRLSGIFFFFFLNFFFCFFSMAHTVIGCTTWAI